MLSSINDFRTGEDAWYWNEENETKTTCAGLSALTYDYTLEAVAMQRAAEIALFYSHTRPNGDSCATALYECGDYEWGVTLFARGANIAVGYTSVASVFNAWQEANELYEGQGHCRNILSKNFTAVGIAHVTCDGYDYWEQVFGMPTSLNTIETTAFNDEDTVTIEVANNDVTSVTLTADPDFYDLSCMGSSTLPTLTAKLTMTNTWPRREEDVTVVSPTWSSSDTSIATVNNDDGMVGAGGLTTITATALNDTIEVSITVNHVTVIQNVKDATCTESGYSCDEVCTVCDETVSAGKTVSAIGHSYDDGKVTKEAACTDDGVMSFTCVNCGNTHNEVIPAAGHTFENGVCTNCGENEFSNISECTITLFSTIYTYDGTAKKPSVTVKNGATILISGTDYTVAYDNNTNAGTATVTVTGMGKYAGTDSKTFTINKASQTVTASVSNPSLTGVESTTTITADTTGDSAITYSSSDTDVVTVDSNGKVVADGYGTAVITVTAAATENYEKSSTSI